MKHLFLFVFATCLLGSLSAQTYPNLLSNTKVTTIGYWKLGQKARYHVTSGTKSYKSNSDKIQKEEIRNYDLELKVVDSTDTSYVFEMRYRNFEVTGAEDAFTAKLSKLQLESVIRYQTDELGVFDTILNLEQLNKELLEKLEQSKALVAEDPKLQEKTEVYNMVIDVFKKNFEKIENVEALYLTDIIPLHGYYGIEMVVSKPMDLELVFPTVGDIVVTGTGKLTLNAINKPGDECSFSVSGKPNKDELKEYLQSFAMLFMIDSGKKLNIQEVTINLNQKTKMKMELSTGWMTKVTDITTLVLKDNKRELKKVATAEYVKQ